MQGKNGEVYYNARAYETDTFDKNSELYPEFMCLFTFKKEFTANEILVYPVISKMKQTEYEKYGVLPSKEYPSEIKSVGEEGNIEILKCNKNILDFKKEDWRGVYFNNDGTENNFYQTDQCLEDIKYYSCNENETITLSFKILKDCKICRGQILIVDAQKKPITIYNIFYENIYKTGEKFIKTFAIPKNAELFKINFRWIRREINNEYVNINMKDEFYDYIGDLMIEKGNTATEYEEHEEERFILPVQQPLRRIGNIADTFIKKEEKWYERHKIERIEEYKDETIETEYKSTTGELSQGATVDYILEEPKDLECTKEQEEALEKIKETRTYKNETIIYSTEEVKPIIEIKYRKDIETILENITEAIIATGGV